MKQLDDRGQTIQWLKSIFSPRRTLLVIDMQNDFIDGSLTCQGPGRSWKEWRTSPRWTSGARCCTARTGTPRTTSPSTPAPASGSWTPRGSP